MPASPHCASSAGGKAFTCLAVLLVGGGAVANEEDTGGWYLGATGAATVGVSVGARDLWADAQAAIALQALHPIGDVSYGYLAVGITGVASGPHRVAGPELHLGLAWDTAERFRFPDYRLEVGLAPLYGAVMTRGGEVLSSTWGGRLSVAVHSLRWSRVAIDRIDDGGSEGRLVLWPMGLLAAAFNRMECHLDGWATNGALELRWGLALGFGF